VCLGGSGAAFAKGVVAAGAGNMLPGMHDGAVEHRVFVISIGCEMLESALLYAGLGPSPNRRLSDAVAPTEPSRPGDRSLAASAARTEASRRK
jgi:hypothetical protein